MSNIILNKYKITDIIGKGKFGIVYKGIHLKTYNEIAIKKEYNNSIVKILKHETTILNYLYSNGCRCIPHIYWFGVFNNSTYLVMTYYKCSLYEYKKNNEINFIDFLKIMKKLIQIMEFIHEKMIIHRDIKPQNFMMDANNELFLIDFGLASVDEVESQTELRRETLKMTQESKEIVDEVESQTELRRETLEANTKEFIIGTPRYISYYIHEGFTPSRRDDLISIGYIFIFLLLGSLPWDNIIETLSIPSSSPEFIVSTMSATPLSPQKYPENHILYFKNTLLKSQKKIDNIILLFKKTFNNGIIDYLNYCYKLDPEKDPQYNYLYYIVKKMVDESMSKIKESQT